MCMYQFINIHQRTKTTSGTLAAVWSYQFINIHQRTKTWKSGYIPEPSYQFINIHQRTKTARYCVQNSFGLIASTRLYFKQISRVKETLIFHLLTAKQFHLAVLFFRDNHCTDRSRRRKVILHYP